MQDRKKHKKRLGLLTFLLLWRSIVFSQEIFVSSDKYDLYRIDIASCSAEFITKIKEKPTDISFHPNDTLFGIAGNGKLFEINHYGLKVHSFGSRLKVCLFNDKISVVTFIWISMMLQIFVDHFICNISGTPTAKAYCPEMTTPITLLQFRELHLQFPRGTSL